jgi:hypothetical protein
VGARGGAVSANGSPTKLNPLSQAKCSLRFNTF